MPLFGNWNFPTSIRFGAGRIRELADACKEVGLRRPLLVTDPGLARLSMVSSATLSLRKAGIEVAVFSDVKPNPVLANVEAGVRVLRAGKHDGVIAWGGGSGIDTGKAVAFMAGQTRPLWDFEDVGDWYTRANPAGICPSIAVPTTAGTGSETGRAVVITDPATKTKKIIFHPKMMPQLVIADPELTIGLPARLTAGTGMDAFCHCLEAYCAPGYHPYAEGIAVEGMRLVKENLARAVRDGRDIEARGHMLAASQMGSTAFQKGLGAIHALSHPVGAVLDTHHGLTNAVVMPYVIQFNRAAIEDKIVRLARWLNLRTPTFEGFQQWTLDLRREAGIPHTLAELGVKAEHLEKFSEMAAVDPTAGGNPVKAGVPEMRRMYEAAVAGRL
ncbi:MAG: iron-containing alcohol dehydrogenase [Reyranella sp.]|uniref:iron-containing alcohol dehydrogenase n=1 Tax=Reyranella sp. TaxID=1929291 RepID=UPI001212EE45|nr:iron-containing alcohol dehydrogenase [Reyranella sp.]TAJ90790.1 MAG: iron-containing alcohol dehydrogenase [Reyranella sp.]